MKLFVNRALIVFFTSLTLISSQSSAVELNYFGDDFKVNLDTTLGFGASVSLQERDMRLAARSTPGGSGNSANFDNGRLNYDLGDWFSINNKITSELDVSSKWVSAFVRGSFLYDYAVMHMDTDRTPLTSDAEERLGRDLDLLDAYLKFDFDVGPTFLTIRAGKQVISWGESTFIQNGINNINPIDVARFRTAGAQLKEGLIPIWAVDGYWELTNRFSLEGFYQLWWEETEIEPEGTFFSTNDFASPGGKHVFLGFGAAPDNPALLGTGGMANPVGLVVPRGGDKKAGHQGQFGVAFRWFEPYLNDTELSFYYTRLHSRLPVINAKAGTLLAFATAAGGGGGDYASSANYFVEYPEAIQTWGFGYNTEIQSLGLALQGEFIYRLDQPIQVDDVELLFAALSPLDPFAMTPFSLGQLGPQAFEAEIPGFREKDMLQFQQTATKIFGPTPFWDQMVFVGEYGITVFPDLEGKDTLRYEGPGTTTSGNPLFTGFGVQPATQTNGFADKVSMGYRLLTRLTFNDVLAAVNLLPTVAFSHDVMGTTPSPVLNFVEDRMVLTAGISATYLSSWFANVSYTTFWGSEAFNLVHDKDFLSATLRYSF